MTEDQTNWVGMAVEVCKAAAAHGVSVTITRRVSSSGIDETNFEVGAFVQSLAAADYQAKANAG